MRRGENACGTAVPSFAANGKIIPALLMRGARHTCRVPALRVPARRRAFARAARGAQTVGHRRHAPPLDAPPTSRFISYYIVRLYRSIRRACAENARSCALRRHRTKRAREAMRMLCTSPRRTCACAKSVRSRAESARTFPSATGGGARCCERRFADLLPPRTRGSRGIDTC